MTRYAMVMDQRRCIGCSSCTIACRTWNELPIDIIYNPVVSNGAEGVWPHVHMTFQPLICMHCDKPACVPACPAGALSLESGRVRTTTASCGLSLPSAWVARSARTPAPMAPAT